MASSRRGWFVSAIALILAACGGPGPATAPDTMELAGTWSGTTPVYEVLVTLTTVWSTAGCTGGLFNVCKAAPAASVEGTLRDRATGETIALQDGGYSNLLPPRDSAVSLTLRDNPNLPGDTYARYYFFGRRVGEATLQGWLVSSRQQPPEPVVVDSTALTLRRR